MSHTDKQGLGTFVSVPGRLLAWDALLQDSPTDNRAHGSCSAPLHLPWPVASFDDT